MSKVVRGFCFSFVILLNGTNNRIFTGSFTADSSRIVVEVIEVAVAAVATAATHAATTAEAAVGAAAIGTDCWRRERSLCLAFDCFSLSLAVDWLTTSWHECGAARTADRE